MMIKMSKVREKQLKNMIDGIQKVNRKIVVKYDKESAASRISLNN